MGIGNSATPLAMILGCAPSAADKIADEPFSDPAGRVLRQLANSVGLNQTNTWVTTLFKYKFPNNRLPFADEVQAVRHLLYLEWCEVHKPQLIITVGPTATEAVLGRRTAWTVKTGHACITKSKCGLSMVVMPMIHPMHGLRDESIRAMIDKHWCDLGTALASSRKEAADKAHEQLSAIYERN